MHFQIDHLQTIPFPLFPFRPHPFFYLPLISNTPLFSHQTNSHHRKVVQLEAQLLALRTETRNRNKTLELAASKTTELQNQCQQLEHLLQEKQKEMEEVVERMVGENEAVVGRCEAMAAAATVTTSLREQLAASLVVKEQLAGEVRKGIRALEEKEQRLTASGRENSMLKRRCGEMQTLVNDLQKQINTGSPTQSPTQPSAQPLTQSQEGGKAQAQAQSQSSISSPPSVPLPDSDLALAFTQTTLALDRLTAEHVALQQVHGEMQTKANKCVKRLLAVHGAFEEVSDK